MSKFKETQSTDTRTTREQLEALLIEAALAETFINPELAENNGDLFPEQPENVVQETVKIWLRVAADYKTQFQLSKSIFELKDYETVSKNAALVVSRMQGEARLLIVKQNPMTILAVTERLLKTSFDLAKQEYLESQAK